MLTILFKHRVQYGGIKCPFVDIIDEHSTKMVAEASSGWLVDKLNVFCTGINGTGLLLMP